MDVRKKIACAQWFSKDQVEMIQLRNIEFNSTVEHIIVGMFDYAFPLLYCCSYVRWLQNMRSFEC